MQPRMTGRTAIVIGAGQGIGRAIAERLSHDGAHVVLADIDGNAARAAAEPMGPRAMGLAADVSDPAAMDALARATLDRFGRIDILVQAAGIYPEAEIAALPLALWRRIMSVNLDGALFSVQAVLPAMRAAGYGRIVLVSSITGPRVTARGTAAYSASKGGINGFVRTAALEFAGHGITVNAVEPGNIMTEGLTAGRSQDFIDDMAASIPVGRLGTPADVAAATAFLASEEAGFVTGTSIVVDGGQILPEGKAAF